MDERITVSADAPELACDLTDAADTAQERMTEYDRLFTRALVGRDRTAERVRLRFRADDGVAAWVRDLAVREKACCPFYDFTVTVTKGAPGGAPGVSPDGEVWWDIGLVDGAAHDEHTARTLLDTYYHAPDYAAEGVAGLTRWLADNDVTVATNESGTVMRFDNPDHP